TETDVGQIFLAVNRDNAHHMIEFGAKLARVDIENARRDKPRLKPDIAKQLIKQSIELIAKTAAFSLHDLLVKLVSVQNDRPLPMNIQIFKRNIQQMLPLQKA